MGYLIINGSRGHFNQISLFKFEYKPYSIVTYGAVSFPSKIKSFSVSVSNIFDTGMIKFHSHFKL